MLHPKVLPVLLCFLAVGGTIFGEENNKERRGGCSPHNKHEIIRIGAIIDDNSVVGREQKVAMEIGAQDFNHKASTSFKLKMVFDKHPHQSSAASAAIDLVRRHTSLHAIVGQLSMQESVIVSEFTKLPLIILNSNVIPTKSPPSNIFHMNNHNILTMQMHCISDIISHFNWPKLTALYEQTNTFSSVDLAIITQFSDSLKTTSPNSVIDHHLGFPPISSLNHPEPFIQQELQKLKENSTTMVFVILQASVEFAKVLFKKANEEGMMKQGYVWIISDKLATSLESMEPSHRENMQGVIGIKTHIFQENTKPHKEFKLKFLRKFITEFADDDDILLPSRHAFRAYDAIMVLGKAMERSQANISSTELTHQILASDFKGLSGRLRFKNGFLSQKIVFSIVNVIGSGFKEVSKWEQNSGFFEGSGEGLNRVFWPGGEQQIPLGYSVKKRLKIAVPLGACEQIVKVSFDKEKNNEPSFTGFSIQVFEAAKMKLDYPLQYDPYELFNGTYSELVKAVNDKVYDAAIGDITILANRYKMVDFSLPYIESSIVMIVPATSGISKERFAVMKAFKWETWLLMAAMNIITAAVIYLNENINGNPDFVKDSPSQHIAAVLWLSITIYTLSQRQYIRHNLSRLVLAAWLCVVIVVAACFTAVLSSIMTVKGLHPMITDMNTNVNVGCNERSFIAQYLKTDLNFPSSKVVEFQSLDDYPDAFDNGRIKAAFLSAPHAKVFLAKYCNKYAMAGPTWKLGGMGFVFQKNSNLAKDISEAILNITENGEIDKLEIEMISSFNCSSLTDQADALRLGIRPFSGLLIISGTICGMVLISAIFRLSKQHWSIYKFFQSLRVCICISSLLAHFYSTNGFTFFRRPSTIQRTNVEMTTVHVHENGEDQISRI